MLEKNALLVRWNACVNERNIDLAKVVNVSQFMLIVPCQVGGMLKEALGSDRSERGQETLASLGEICLRYFRSRDRYGKKEKRVLKSSTSWRTN